MSEQDRLSDKVTKTYARSRGVPESKLDGFRNCVDYAILLNPKGANDPDYIRQYLEKCVELYGGEPKPVDMAKYVKYKCYLDALEKPEISPHALAASHRVKRMYNVDWDVSDVGFTRDSWIESVNDYVVGLVDDLVGPVAEKTGVRADDLRNRLKEVSMIDDPQIQGFTRTSDSWKTFDIILHRGLMILCHKMTKVFVGRVGFMDEDGKHIVEDTQIPWEETVSVANDLMWRFWRSDLESSKTIRLVALSDSQLRLWSSLLYHMDLFIVAHEFGHVVANLCAYELEELSRGISIISQILAGIPDLAQTQTVT